MSKQAREGVASTYLRPHHWPQRSIALGSGSAVFMGCGEEGDQIR